MTNTYKIAGRIIEIGSLYRAVHDYCKDYRFDGIPDFFVKTSVEDIVYEREKSIRNALFEGKPTGQYTDAYLEELAVYRQIAEKMPFYDTFLFHGSAVAVDGQAYLFTAKSGTGKSTHTRLWRKLLGNRAIMINDDKPLITVSKSGVTVYGTPYNGKHRLGSNTAFPLKAICILQRSEENHIVQITPKQAYPMLLQQSYRPNDKNALVRTMTLIDELSCQVTFWKMDCNMELTAAEMSYHAMKG